MPIMERQSGRLGVISQSSTTSDGAQRTGVIGHAHGRVLGQDHDARVVAAQAELALGAVHAARHHAAQLALLDLDPAGELRPDEGDDDVVAGVEVLGAADDLQRLGVAVARPGWRAPTSTVVTHMWSESGWGSFVSTLAGDHVVERGRPPSRRPRPRCRVRRVLRATSSPAGSSGAFASTMSSVERASTTISRDASRMSGSARSSVVGR